ncbi:MAG: ATP-binding protein [Roseateles sp.]|uniref:ATP-binding protein n=1 Tax=Roseateles sp. TaxID=1971397 RepID=UPI0040358E69
MATTLRRPGPWRPNVQQLLAASILLALVPLFIVVVAGWRVERARLISAAEDQIESTVALVAMLERRRYDGARQVLEAISAAPVVSTADRDKCNPFLAGVQRAFPQYTNLGLADLDGRIVCSAVTPATHVVVNDRAYFKQALRSSGVSAEYVIGRVTKLRALTFAARLERVEGAGPSGVVFAALDLDRAAARLRSLKLPDFMQVDITTGDGIVLASTHSDASVLGGPVADDALLQRIRRAGLRQTLAPQAGRFESVRLIGDFHPTAIVVATRLDTAKLLAPVTRRLLNQIAALLMAAALGAALAWRLGRRGIAMPIAGLLSRMRQFAAGQPDEAAPQRPQALELTALHDEFTRLQQTLQERASERENLLDELKILQAKVVASQRISRIGYWEIDLRTGRLGGTSHLAGLLGTAIPQTLDAWLARLAEADREPLQAALQAAWAGSGALDIEYPMRLAGAAQVWVRMRGELRTAPDGKPVQLRGSVQDITERKEAEMRLAAQMGRLQLLHRITRAIADRQSIADILRVVVAQLEEQMPLGFCAAAPFDPRAKVITIEQLGARSVEKAGRMSLAVGDTIATDGDGLSRAVGGELVYEPATAVSPHELPQRLASIGLQAMVLVPLSSQGGVFGVILAARATGDSFSSTDCEFLRQLGEQVALALHQAELYTALRKAYDTLEQSQTAALKQERLRALGEMASGIAHDINNAVSPLVLYIESLLKHEAGLSAAGRQKLATMQLAAEGIASTVERMREFHPTHDIAADTRHASVNAAIRQVIELTQARWRDAALRGGAKIDTETDLGPDIPEVQINAGDLRDAFTNLVFNAVDAMPNGGVLSFRTRCLTEHDNLPMVEVCIADTGVGMSAQTRRQCLEPFFTTKAGRGTGLGLAMVYAMVQRNHGRLDIDTAPGKGTTVRMQLPVQALLPEPATGPAAGAVDAAPLRLLLVDDDPFVLYPLGDAMRDDGHDVSLVESGREAIELFRGELTRGRAFDVVITDLGMPYVDGSHVAREVKALRPATRVVMLTGWGRRMANDSGHTPFVDCLLCKPPRLDEVRAALRPAVTAPPPGAPVS